MTTNYIEIAATHIATTLLGGYPDVGEYKLLWDKSLKPFDQLAEETQKLDDKYRDAIIAVSGTLDQL